MTKLLYTDKCLEAGLYDVCEWFVEFYPEDVFLIKSKHPVNNMRNLAKEVLKLRNKNTEDGNK